MRLDRLYVKVDGEDIVVAPCTIDLPQGGVFACEETDRERRTVKWRRIGTLSQGPLAKVNKARAA